MGTISVSGVRYYGYRHYSPGIGRWLTRDPIGEWGGVSLYAYVANDPETHIDALGQWVIRPGYDEDPSLPSLSATSHEAPRADGCGAYLWTVLWTLSKPAKWGGWILQEIEKDIHAYDCDGRPVDCGVPTRDRHFFELFGHVPPDMAHPLDGPESFGDTWFHVKGCGECTWGFLTITGWANFWDAIGPDPGPPFDLHFGGGFAPQWRSDRWPGWERRGTRAGRGLYRALYVEWNCCTPDCPSSHRLVAHAP